MKAMKKLLSTLDQRTGQALAASVRDAILWSLMFGLAENYVLPFAILFGAQAIHTSLIQGIGQLGVAAAQFFGAEYILKHPNRQRLCIIGNIIHASSWLVVFFGALVFRNPWVILVAYAIGLFATSFPGPGWISWMNDLVPEDIRGAYWGKRNNISGIIQFVAIMSSGIFLAWAKPLDFTLPAFGIMFSLAFAFRFSSIWVLKRQYEPPMEIPPPQEVLKFRSFVLGLPKNPFGRFVIFSILTTFAVNIMNPVVSVYLLNTLQVDYFSYTMITMASMVMSFLAMSYWGPLTDRFGNYRILMVTAVLLPFLAVAWAIFKAPPALIAVQLVNGFVWAGFNLSTTNYIFDSVSKAHMAKNMAFFQCLNNVCAFLGSLTGGALSLVTPMLDIGQLFQGTRLEWIFLLSGLLRALVIILLLKTFSEVRKVDPAPPLRYFYIYQPFTIFLNRFQTLAGRLGNKITPDRK